MPCALRLRAAPMTIIVVASAGASTVPAKADANGAGANARAGSSTTSNPREESRSAPARAIASAMMTSVPSGRCGPCASTAPAGSTATVRSTDRSRTAVHVSDVRVCTAIRAFEFNLVSVIPTRLNLTAHLLDARIAEGRGARPAIRTDARTVSYEDVARRSAQYASLLAADDIRPEERVIIDRKSV